MEKILGTLDQLNRSRLNALLGRISVSSHWLIAHAAFPVALTSDLLYKIWVNFRPKNPQYGNTPLSVVSQILLSSICRETGRDIYEIYPPVRSALITHIWEHPGWGQERIEELAKFLRIYVDQCRNRIPSAAFAQAQRWIADAFLQPDRAAESLREVISDGVHNGWSNTRIHYFISWAKQLGINTNGEITEGGGNNNNLLLNALRIAEGVELYNEGAIEEATEKFKTIRHLLEPPDTEPTKCFQTYIPKMVWDALEIGSVKTPPIRSKSIKHLYLPKLFEGANIDKPVSDSLWENKQEAILLAISDGIEIGETALTRGISSIPDIYARPMTFLRALRSDKHPQRKRTVQEWRGLLSLIALHKVKSDLGNFMITPVALHDDTFSTALVNLAPKPIMLQENGIEYSWTDILLIRFKNQDNNIIPLGAFSPATLIYTSADYSSRLKDIPFSLKDEQGYLKPPGKSDGLDYVGQWLEWFIRQFNQYSLTSAHPSGDHQYVADINKLLDTWLMEIKQELGIGITSVIVNAKVRLADEPVEIPSSPFLAKYDIYKALLTPLIKDEAAAEAGNKSEYSLKMARNRSKYKEMVLITTSLLSQDRILWDEFRPSELDRNTTILVDKFFQAESGTRINYIDLENDDSIWIRPELFFLTNTLLKAKNGEILNSNEKLLNAGNAEYILPFKKEILEFFNPVEIHEILRPSFRETDGKVTFSFFLPLENNFEVEVEKIYTLEEDNIRGDEGHIVNVDVPVLEIFPNYLGDFWCQYFMFCTDAYDFLIEPVNYEQQITIKRKERLFVTNTLRNRAEIIRISGYNSFPEGIAVKPKRNTAQAYGLILLNKNAEMEGRPFRGSCRVGIDIGTFNTNIFKFSNGNAARWKFSFSRYLRSVLNSSPTKRRDATRLFFVPTADQELPIPTALRIFKAGITEDILLDHFIYFPYGSRYPDNVHTNMKWDDEDIKMKSFLKGLIFLLMIELVQQRVSKIEFRCSYPKSFTDDRTRAFKRGWTETLEGFFHISQGDNTEIGQDKFIYTDSEKFNQDDDDYIITTKNNGKLVISVTPKFTTEGISVGEYFSSEYIITDGISHANKEDGAVCIDVGGATSDYSIWFGSKIRLDASILLSGNQIAIYLNNNSRVRDILFSEEATSALNEEKYSNQFFSRLNFVLGNEEKSISLKLKENAKDRDIVWLKRIIAIEFGALSFYAAHLCLALDEFLEGDLAERVKQVGIKVHWGGKAAKFINWLSDGSYEKDGIASKLLNGMFVNTIMDKSIGARAFRPALIGQVQSPGHKDEASGGIVVMNMNQYELELSFADNLLFDQDKERKEFLDGLIMGEKLIINGRKYEHYDVVNRDSLFTENVSNFNGTELVQLERFIYLINHIGTNTGLFPEGSQINLSIEEKLTIKQRIKNNFTSLTRLKPNARLIEPVFILEVKYLLDILSNKMKNDT